MKVNGDIASGDTWGEIFQPLFPYLLPQSAYGIHLALQEKSCWPVLMVVSTLSKVSSRWLSDTICSYSNVNAQFCYYELNLVQF